VVEFIRFFSLKIIRMQTPIWITNFKNYEQAVNENAVSLAIAHENVWKDTNKNIAIAVNALDLQSVTSIVHIPVGAQHVDPIGYGSKTGQIHPQVVKNSHAQFTLLNHSECRFNDDEKLKLAVEKCREIGLVSIVCAESPEEIKKFAEFKPDFLAYEPPELIGSSDVSVASKPECITDSLKFCGDIPLIVGAGIARVEDVKISLELGAQGFLVASAITKADDPEGALRDFVAVFG
jgi:triosephosphate isomerase